MLPEAISFQPSGQLEGNLKRKEELKIFQNSMNCTKFQINGYNENRAKMKVHSYECLHKKLQRSHTHQLTACQKALVQIEAQPPKINRQQEMIKLKTKINKKIKDNKTKNQATNIWFFEEIIRMDKTFFKTN